VRLPIPKAIERRLRPWITRGEEFARTWEWTWTSAFLAGIGISFLAITTLAVIPSWWLYFAEQTLGWTTEDRLLIAIRDMVALGWITVWVGVFVVTAYMVQSLRRRLRGEKQAERYSGGYR
jgi:type II secretory pathway component PulF